jgi:dCTP deaminase
MSGDNGAGILPSQAIAALAGAGGVSAELPFAPDQIQPASLDLRLGKKALRIRASFLPGPKLTVAHRLAELSLHEIDLSAGAVLETGCVYVVPLMEALALPADVAAAANPKSSTGRLDVFTRVIIDRAQEFDKVPAAYRGPLYLEISPRTFPVVVRAGSRLSQIRFRRGASRLDDVALLRLHRAETLVDSEPNIAGGLAVSIDLEPREGIVGYRAKRHTGVIDVDRRAGYELLDYWEPIAAHRKPELVLDPDQFYVLASREAVHVPPLYAAEMVPFDPLVGEFRVHYAGFFDPGFGHSAEGGAGSRAVLEVRSHEVPFILEHGQIVGRLIYERMSERPRILYGEGIGSHYQAQGLKLSKHFR